MQEQYDVIVVGGGAIGAAVAWQLGRHGQRVLLLERGRIGGESSGAAAGMLGAQLEVDAPGLFYELCLKSRAMYTDFAAALYEDTGIDIQLTHNGILHLAMDEKESEKLQQRLAWQKHAGSRAVWYTASDIAAMEPGLGSVSGALLLPDDSNVFASHLVEALARAAARYGSVVEGADVREVTALAGHVRVSTVNKTYVAEHVVVASGAWADRLVPNEQQFGITPVKGQLLALRPAPHVYLRHTVFSHDVYLVPKRDGTVIVGATEEHEEGYNRDVTVAGIHHLMSAVLEIAPGLAQAEFIRAWVGLRPKSQTGSPVIGPLPGHPRIIVAVGHFRNGILLTPITAEIVKHHLTDQGRNDLYDAFSPTRSSEFLVKEVIR